MIENEDNKKLINPMVNKYSEEQLLAKDIDGETLLEKLIDNNEEFYCASFSTEEAFKIIYNKKRFDLLEYVSFDVLIGQNESNLELIVDYFLSNPNSFNLSSLDPFLFTENINIIAKFYLLFARKGLIEYLRELTDEELFKKKNGKYLIDVLLESNKNLTLNVILCDEVKKSFKVGTYLKLHNFSQEEIRIPIMPDSFVSNYIRNFYEEYHYIKLDYESEEELDTLRDFMLSDNESNRDLIDLLLDTYRYSIQNNNPYARDEVIQLCNIKMNNPNFSFKINSQNSCFDPIFKYVFLDKKLIDTLNHELGHALFNLLSDREVPSEYYDLVLRVRNNPETINNLDKYSKRYYEISETINQMVDEAYDDYFNDIRSEKSIEYIKNYLSWNKEQRINEYIKKGYRRETLEQIFKHTFTVEEYLKQHEQILKTELRDIIFRCEYGYYLAVGDIMDAIFMGSFFDEKLKNKNGEVIKGCSGHGIYYYNSEEIKAFDEIMANYSQILKSPHRVEGLNLLRNMVGNKMADLIDEYYRQRVVKSDKYEEVRTL